MKKTHSLYLSFGILALLSSCGNDEKSFDASGSFEAVETIISSEASGRILSFQLEEGQEIDAGYLIGSIDSTQLFLKKEQLEEQIQALLGKRPNISVQLSALEAQLSSAKVEKARIERLVKDNATASKQQDDISAQITLIENQMAALKSTLTITSEGITRDAGSMELQIAQLNDQLEKCRLVSPMKGTVLSTFVRANEIAAPGKPLYKIADLSSLELRAYISGNQLAKVRLNQRVKVFADDGDGGMQSTQGTITWISNKAEFTPKSIQTKEERSNKVYAIKIRVANDGRYKIGMYGEIQF